MGDECALEDRVSVKRTVVGAGCQLGAGSKVRCNHWEAEECEQAW